MNLSTKLATHFAKNVRKRGEEYHWQRRVRIERGTQSAVEAMVSGSQAYRIELRWRDNTLHAWCDCPYFIDNAIPCKHLWATILAADQKGYLAAAASSASVHLECEDIYSDSELEYEDMPRDTSLRRTAAPKPVEPRKVSWQERVSDILGARAQAASFKEEKWPAKREAFYVIDAPSSWSSGGLVLLLQSRDRKKNSEWSQAKPLVIKRTQIAELPAEDREILSILAGGRQHGYSYYGYFGSYDKIPESIALSPFLAGMLMPLLTRTGRCYLRLDNKSDSLAPLAWDDSGSWRFELEVRPAGKEQWAAAGALRRGEETMDLVMPVLITPGFVFTQDRVAPLAEEAPFSWISALRSKGAVVAPAKEQDEFLGALLCSPDAPPVKVPEKMRYAEEALQPHPQARISRARVKYGTERLLVELAYAYDGGIVSAFDPARGIFDAKQRRFLPRDFEAERAAAELLNQLGVKLRPANYWDPEPAWELAPSKLPRVVRSLVEAGWQVEAEGRFLRRPAMFHMEVTSGVDWFELHGEVNYGDATARVPELLEALRRGEKMVRLDDGTYGMLPEEWLLRISPLAGIGTLENGHIRFSRSQAGLLDALLASQPEARCDEAFARLREELHRFHGVEPAEQPAGFVGRLRDYQREGLAWMHFLQRFSFGGCLADDMGVGKTAQVLALLETRPLRAGPSLVVAPRSLVFNWKEEAARFTPQLRVLDHTGLARNSRSFADFDMVLTTYGTLRRDIVRLKDVDFDYVVLDEAQAVKNADTESSKAVRLLRGRHRLALSGTPVENHLGELWTLFEFLNPGMLGAASAFKLAGGAMRNPDEQTRRLLAQALRPFILRRTKEQVARELPPKSEQTVYCEMDPPQRKLYNELRQHYRDSLLKRIESEGLAKSKIQVLEALLRLRQAACHPGLLDAKRAAEPSAKLESLLEQIQQVLDEGHKALVFSQFTSLLKILRDRLDDRGLAYEYLDGSTRDRQACVQRFQTDESCRLFLVSLKAGGLGLNLTAAEYVFILDPWWNPAVEAQAVDRAHRIGQHKRVFAYRLITRDTVEEKVLELQKTKRDLASAVIGAENSVIRDIRAEELAFLLS